MKLELLAAAVAVTAALGSADDEERPQTAVVTHVTYLPFEQHRCASMFLLNNVDGGALPAAACEPGACCVRVANAGVNSGGGGGAIQEIGSDGKVISGGDNGGNEGDNGSGDSGESGGSGGNGDNDKGAKVLTEVETETFTTNTVITTVETITTGVPVVISEETTLAEPITEEFSLSTDEVVTTVEPVATTEVFTSGGSTVTETLTTSETLTTTKEVTTTKKVKTTEEITTSTIITTEERVTTTEPTTEVMTTTETHIIVGTFVVTTTTIEPVADIPSPATNTYTKACPTPTCQRGVQDALFSNPFRGDTSRNYKTFQPSYFKDKQPLESGVAYDIYVRDDGTNKTLANAALEYRGFMFACQTGDYTFRSPRSDDITIMWFGDKAYRGWTRDNADIIQFYYGDNSPKQFTRTITAGTYYPIRVFWGNTGSAADLSLQIFAPDGRQLYGHDSGNSASYLTTEACDGAYPPYPPFGQEV